MTRSARNGEYLAARPAPLFEFESPLETEVVVNCLDMEDKSIRCVAGQLQVGCVWGGGKCECKCKCKCFFIGPLKRY
jgi:hypothetical protein